jgi:multidrug efflux pump
MLCGRFLKPKIRQKARRDLSRERTRLRYDARFYARTLKWVLRREYLMLVVTGVIVLTVWLYTVVPKGFFRNRTPGN